MFTAATKSGGVAHSCWEAAGGLLGPLLVSLDFLQALKPSVTEIQSDRKLLYIIAAHYGFGLNQGDPSGKEEGLKRDLRASGSIFYPALVSPGPNT